MTNLVLAGFALGGLALFLGIIIWRVPEPSLIIVFTVVFAMAVYDFWLELKRRREQNGG